MSLIELKTRIAALVEDAEPGGEMTIGSVIGLLAGLLCKLEELHDEGRLGPGQWADAIESWEDDEYLYVQTGRPEGAATDIDISSFGQSLFIRMAKPKA
jgi:hypothetical protein